MIEVIILAIALSMDAFAVAIGLGSKQERNTKSLAFMSAIYFGFFQGVMPWIGYVSGESFLSGVTSYAHWLAAALLFLIGTKMIYESMNEGIEQDIAKVTHRVILILAIATSADAMAAGFTLPLLNVDPVIACAIIGLVTLCFSWLGVVVGAKSGTWLESKAELLGGIVLILIGIKILLF